MKERPILFSSEMVRAILEGRKTQTRRVINDEYMGVVERVDLGMDDYWHGFHGRIICFHRKCPYGQPGDRLWVRETFWHYGLGSELGGRQYYYKCDMDLPAEFQIDHFMKWKPSIFMPRWASRIQLEITNIRVERVQEISEEDAKAEGSIAWHDTHPDHGTVYKPEYRLLWDKINAKRGYSWTSNPWVWVVEFRRLKP